MNTQLQTQHRAASVPRTSFTPVRSGILQRKCACGGTPGPTGECEACRKKREAAMLQRAAVSPGPVHSAPPIVHEVLRSPGQALDPATRTFMEPRFGHDFSQVRVHMDGKAAESARAVHAQAYTVRQHVVFGPGQYAPNTAQGKALLAHELTHTIQQSGSPAGSTHLLTSTSESDLPDTNEREAEAQAKRVVDESSPVQTVQVQQRNGICRLQRSAAPAQATREAGEFTSLELGTSAGPTGGSLRPETCPPPPEMHCPPATSSPAGVTNTLFFPLNSASLNPTQRAEIDAAAAAWHAALSSVIIQVDGYASAIGDCGYNWDLSCRRAQAIARELESPTDGSTGVPSSQIELFAHGESDQAGSALAPNQNATISMPIAPPPPPSCAFPVSLGSARGCGTGPDFTHFDFPKITAASEAKLAAWAAAHLSPSFPYTRGPFRSLVTDTECQIEMDGVLRVFAGADGHRAFSRFTAGTGGTETHGPASTLGSNALVSGSFLATVARVKADIEAQLAAQASSGVLDACALSVTPPATHFAFSDGTALKAVIGGTQGEELFATGFTGSIASRSYSIDLRFVICDDFGVSESDLYAPGLVAFWVLQHERSATRYAPFINELDLPVTVTGTF